MDLNDDIKAEAYRLGFSLVGITIPDPPPHYGVFEGWLQAGRHAGMAYLASQRSRQRHADPRQILPECRSILVLAAPYPSAYRGPAPEGSGRVAAYAWGEDYHDVLLPRLKALASFIQARVDEPLHWRAYTDSGPLLERDLAQRAGLGWIGKNTCLINPLTGSYFFLAELLLSLELEPDPPFAADRCGSCRRCIDACPTQCILPDRTLDAGRCISYLTIENKGTIPPDLRPLTGDWIFGCDVCQAVCPYNLRFAPPEGIGGGAVFAPRPGVANPYLHTELRLSPPEFNHKFRRSPIKRPHRRGYLRNVAVALGNARDPAAVPELGEVLSHEPEPLVRAHAAWALGRIGGEQARKMLLSAAHVEGDKTVLIEIHAALEELNLSGR
jgi:epoxyqueuosine reductase